MPKPSAHRPQDVPQVMVSSTFTDLKEHRDVLIEAINKHGLHPKVMEYDSASLDDVIESSYKMVRVSKAYILIISHKYGQTPKCPKRNPDNLSITELEFNEAQLLGRPTLLFIMGEDHDVKPRDVEPDPAKKAKLDAFRERAKPASPDSSVHRVYAVFNSLDEFKNEINPTIAKLEKYLIADHDPNPTTPPTFKTTIPHNLPTLQPFFGREEELRKIADALDPDSRTWGALIDGPGGMGKTSLAVRAAYDASPEVFKRIIFISLKTRELDDDGVRDLSGFLISGLVELLNELARELRRDDILKAIDDQRPRLLLEALRDTQTLLVLDNLESLIKRERDILFTFVDKLPADCKAILTSRQRIGSGAKELILEKLSQEAALATLAELATRNPFLAKTSEAERLVLYRETAGKPLLLRWTAGQIGREHCLTFTDALHFLRSCPPGNDPLEFIFGDLVEDFEEAETKVICALTYFTLPAKVEHVAAIARLPDAETDRALRKLTIRSLAVPTDELKTFTLVPMVADFLRKKKPEVVAETGDQLEQHAYALIIENGYKNHERFPALEAAWPGIAPALPLLLDGENDRLQTVCNALNQFLQFQGRWDEQLAFFEKAEERAVAAADYHNAGSLAFQSGWIKSLRQQADAVLACADRAAAHWTLANAGAHEHAVALRLRGIGLKLKGEYPSAIAAFREALDLQRSLVAENESVAICLNDLAIAEKESGSGAAAEEHFREGLRVARTIGSLEGMASFSGNLASLALAQKDWPTAETLTREALPLAEAIHRQDLIGSNNYRLALALIQQGKAVEARPHAWRAVEIYTWLDLPDVETARSVLRECEEALKSGKRESGNRK